MALTNDWFTAMQGMAPQQRPTDVFHHQIFYAETVPGRRLRGDVRERAAMSADAQRRWDYFYRPDMSALDEVDAEELKEIKSRTGARGTAFRAYLLSLPFIVVGGLAAGALLGAQAGIAASVILFLSATIGFAFVYFGNTLSDRQDAILSFRRAIAAGIERIEASRPEEHEMRAFFREALEASAEPIRNAVGADPSALLSVTGWTALSPAITLLTPAQSRRAFARAGTLFAVTDVMIVYAETDRLHVNRYAFDVIDQRAHPLEEWSLKRDGVEIGRRTQRDGLLRFPDPDAAAPLETDASNRFLPSMPVRSPTIRELAIAAPSVEIRHRLADPAFFDDVYAAETEAMKTLEAREAALASIAGGPQAAEIDVALEASKRTARWARLDVDVKALHEERLTLPDDNAVDALRRIVYADDAKGALPALTPAQAPTEPTSQPPAPAPPPKKPIHDLY